MNSASFLNRHRRARVRFTPKAGDPWMPVTSTGMTEESFDRLTGIRGLRKRPKLDPFTGIIDRILEEDWTTHRKQRHTAKRIFVRTAVTN